MARSAFGDLVQAGFSVVRTFVLALFRRGRLANAGGTESEFRRRWGGDDVMADPDMRWIRAISIDAPATQVWPWVAQLGRGAGYYSYDTLDNGGRPSAQYLMDLPAPRIGDRNDEIGQVVQVDLGREIVWLTDTVAFLGATAEMALDYNVLPDGPDSSRLVLVVLARARGRTAWLAKAVFAVIDHVMATEQLRGLKARAEGSSASSPTGGDEAGAVSHQRDRVVLAGG